MATGSLVYFPKQATPRKSKPTEKKKPEPKSTVLDWIRNGYQFPGKPAPPENPKPHKPDEMGRAMMRPIELRVKSFTRRGVTYNVTYSKRKWTCDCPDARHRGNACKHIAILRLLGPRRAASLAGGVR